MPFLMGILWEIAPTIMCATLVISSNYNSYNSVRVIKYILVLTGV